MWPSRQMKFRFCSTLWLATASCLYFGHVSSRASNVFNAEQITNSKHGQAELKAQQDPPQGFYSLAKTFFEMSWAGNNPNYHTVGTPGRQRGFTIAAPVTHLCIWNAGNSTHDTGNFGSTVKAGRTGTTHRLETQVYEYTENLQGTWF